jgi:hypothetical protein
MKITMRADHMPDASCNQHDKLGKSIHHQSPSLLLGEDFLEILKGREISVTITRVSSNTV